mmetsp:Transcript_17426/g.24736  ORF Transcript_17426/g.24736 Transcript_17426/m.24736 type:complete len:485 (+) Transcript_17426:68-1522(+)
MAPPRSESTSKSGRSSRRKNWEKCLTVVIFLQSISIIAVFEKHLLNVKEKLKYGQEEIKATKIHDTKHRQYQYRDDDPNNDGLNSNAIDGGRQERPLPFSFSACLLIKDGNILLPEWLAYHYTVLPLRRLIVGVDPLSHTDPKQIFDSYGSIGMDISIWKNDSFWVNGYEAHEKKDYPITNETDHEGLRLRHRYRQLVFYKSCMQQLHDENQTWTVLIDVDEYLAFNYYEEQEGPPTWCKKNVTCAEDYAKSIQDGTHPRTLLDRSPTATVAEHIGKHGVDKNYDGVDKPCVIFGRYLFVSKESSSSREEIQRGLDSDFNATLFHTLRYRYRAPLSTYQLGKSIVDVSRYDGRDLTNIHRPLGKFCTGNNAYVHNAAMSFRVHHYIGSWETFRRPGFDTRGKGFFDKRNNVKNLVVDNTTPRYSSSENSTWLTQFAKLVGKEKALELSQKIRVREEMEMDKVIAELANGAKLHDWDKLNKKPPK